MDHLKERIADTTRKVDATVGITGSKVVVVKERQVKQLYKDRARLVRAVEDVWGKITEEKRQFCSEENARDECPQLGAQRECEEALRRKSEILAEETVRLNLLLERCAGFGNVACGAAEGAARARLDLVLRKLRQESRIERLLDEAEALRAKIEYENSRADSKMTEYERLRMSNAETEASLKALEADAPHAVAQWTDSVAQLNRLGEICTSLQDLLGEERSELELADGEARSAEREVRPEGASLRRAADRAERSREGPEREAERTAEARTSVAELESERLRLRRTLLRKEAAVEIEDREAERMARSKHDAERVAEEIRREKLAAERRTVRALAENGDSGRRGETLRRRTEHVARENARLESEDLHLEKLLADLQAEAEAQERSVVVLEKKLGEAKRNVAEPENRVAESERLYRSGCETTNRLQKRLESTREAIRDEMREAGGVEPAERHVAKLRETLRGEENECQALEQRWLQQQRETMETAQKAAAEARRCDALVERLVAAGSQKLRLQGEAERLESRTTRTGKAVERRYGELERENVRLHEKMTPKRALEAEAAIRDDGGSGTAEAESRREPEATERILRETQMLRRNSAAAKSAAVLWEKRLEELERSVATFRQWHERIGELRKAVVRKREELNRIWREQQDAARNTEKILLRHENLLADLETHHRAPGRQHENRAKARARHSLREVRAALESLAGAETELAETRREEREIAEAIEEMDGAIRELESETEQNDVDVADETREKYTAAVLLASYQHQSRYLDAIKSGERKPFSGGLEKLRGRVVEATRDANVVGQASKKLADGRPEFRREVEKIVDLLAAKEDFL